MSKNFVQNALLRQSLLTAYRGYARAQFWRSGPRIFVNSIPKAGTHLLTAELEKFPQLQNSRLHIEAHRVNVASDGRRAEKFLIDAGRVASQIETVRPGQFFTAHLMWSGALEETLHEKNVKTIVMLRDPRAILVSRLHYIKGLKRHFLHDFFTNGLASDKERYRVLMEGRDGDPYIRSFVDTVDGFLPWLQSASVLCVRFEDLVGERGGGTVEAKRETFRRICDHTGLPTEHVEEYAATAAKTTPTLRDGRADSWRGKLPDDILEMATERLTPSLALMGYPLS